MVPAPVCDVLLNSYHIMLCCFTYSIELKIGTRVVSQKQPNKRAHVPYGEKVVTAVVVVHEDNEPKKRDGGCCTRRRYTTEPLPSLSRHQTFALSIVL